MVRLVRRVALLIVLVSLALTGPATALTGPATARAQDATPAAGMGELIDPAECQAEPRSADELIALWYPADAAGTPVRATPAPASLMTAVPVPLGEPADAATVAGVTATVRGILACYNGGDRTRAMAHFTDDLARQFGPQAGQTVEQVRAVLSAPAAPVPLAERDRLIAITDVSVMADGRVGAIVVLDDPTSPHEGAETDLILFVQDGDRWLADGVVEFTGGAAGGAGTPAP